MMPVAVTYRDALTLIIAGLSICATIFFGHFKTWRHRICFEYDGKQAAAVTAMRDKFQEEAEQHYKAIQDYLQHTGATVHEFYAERKQRVLVKSLALRLERSNRIIRLYSYLTLVSQAIEIGLLIETTILIFSITTSWFTISHFMAWFIFTICLIILVLMILLMFVLLYLEGRFLTATNKALSPEFD